MLLLYKYIMSMIVRIQNYIYYIGAVEVVRMWSRFEVENLSAGGFVNCILLLIFFFFLSFYVYKRHTRNIRYIIIYRYYLLSPGRTINEHISYTIDYKFAPKYYVVFMCIQQIIFINTTIQSDFISNNEFICTYIWRE